MIKRYFGLIALFTIATVFTSCDDPAPKDAFYLQGKVNYDDVAYLYHAKGDSMNAIDTIDLAGSQFSVVEKAQGEDAMYVLTFPGQQLLRFFANAGDTIELNIDLNTSPLTYSVVKGNKYTRDASRLHKLMNNTFPVIDSLDEVRMMYRDSTDEAKAIMNRDVQAAFNALLNEHRDSLVAFIQADSAQLSNVLAFYHAVGPNRILDPQYDLAYFYSVDNGLAASEYADHDIVKPFRREVNTIREAIQRRRDAAQARLNLEVGNLAPSIILNDPYGEEKKLSELRGKITLIHFWASWDPSSRIFNRRLVSIYEQFKNEDFAIYSVSFDGLEEQSVPRQEWRLAIEEDGMAWDYHVSDLKGYRSQIVVDYAVEMIPSNVLIDERGHIIGRNLSPDRIEEILDSKF